MQNQEKIAFSYGKGVNYFKCFFSLITAIMNRIRGPTSKGCTEKNLDKIISYEYGELNFEAGAISKISRF